MRRLTNRSANDTFHCLRFGLGTVPVDFNRYLHDIEANFKKSD